MQTGTRGELYVLKIQHLQFGHPLPNSRDSFKFSAKVVKLTCIIINAVMRIEPVYSRNVKINISKNGHTHYFCGKKYMGNFDCECRLVIRFDLRM